jgi:hypothetical protein
VFGGVAAELGGGKFANGGMSAAFSRMFNDLGHPIGKDFSHSNGKNSHFHDAPLESVTPQIRLHTKEHYIFSTLFFTPIVSINRILYFSRNIF